MSYRFLVSLLVIAHIASGLSQVLDPGPCGSTSDPCPKDVVVNHKYQTSDGKPSLVSYHHDTASDATTMRSNKASVIRSHSTGDSIRVPVSRSMATSLSSYFSFWFKDADQLGMMFSFGPKSTHSIERKAISLSFHDQEISCSSHGWNFLELVRFEDMYTVTLNNAISATASIPTSQTSDIIFGAVDTDSTCSVQNPLLSPASLAGVSLYVGDFSTSSVTIATDLMVLTRNPSSGVEVTEFVGTFAQGYPYASIDAQNSDADYLFEYGRLEITPISWVTILRSPGFYRFNSQMLSSLTLVGGPNDQYFLSMEGGSMGSYLTVDLTGGLRPENVFMYFRSSITLANSALQGLPGTIIIDGDLQLITSPSYISARLLVRGSFIMTTGYLGFSLTQGPICDGSSMSLVAGWKGLMDDVIVLDYVPSNLLRWSLFITKPAFEILANISIYSPMQVSFNDTIVSEIGYSLPTTGSFDSVQDVAFPNQTEYGWILKCNSVRHSLEKCYDSCGLGSGDLSCSGTRQFCDHLSHARSHFLSISVSGSDPEFGIPNLCVSKTSSDCDCDFSYPTLKFSGSGSLVSYEAEVYNVLEHLGTLPSDQRGLAPQTIDPVSDCMFACQKKYCSECFSLSSASRRLLAFGNEQFKVYWFDDYLNIAQDTSSRTCSDCDMTTVYYATMQIGSSNRYSFLVSGAFARYPIPEELVGLTGNIEFEIKDAGSVTLYAETHLHAGVTTSKWKDCLFCSETANNIIGLHWVIKILIVILVLLILKVVLMIVMFAIDYSLWCSKWCRIAGQKLNVCCCCKRIKSGATAAYVVVSDINVEASSLSPTQESYTIDVPVSTSETKTTYVGSPPWLKKPVTAIKSRKDYNQKYTSVMLVIALISILMPTFTSAQCANGLAIDHTTAKCINGACTVSPVFTGTIPSGAREICFEIKDIEKNMAVGSIIVSILKIQRSQPMDFQYVTSEWDGISHSRHVCAGHGLCKHVGTNVGPDDDPEGTFSGADSRLMNYPGMSGAHSSAGCAGNGCFLCSSSCTYYRYALSTQGKAMSMVYRRIGDVSSTIMMNVTITDGNGKSQYRMGTFYANQDFTFEAFGGTVTMQNHGYLSSDNSIILSPEVVVVNHDYKCTDSSDPKCKTGAYGVKSTSVSQTNDPKTGMIGDLQCPITGCELTSSVTRPKYDRGIVSRSQGKQTDDFWFLPSPLKSILDVSDKFPVNGWSIDTLTKDAISVHRDDLVDDKAILLSISSKNLKLSLSVSLVCPEIISVQHIMGEYNSASGCSLDIVAKSTCQPGITIIIINAEGFIPKKTTFEIGNSDTKIRIPGICTSSQIDGSEVKLCSGDRCSESVHIPDSPLNLPVNLLNISTVYATGEVIGGDKVSFSLDTPDSDSSLSAFYRFFSHIIGSDSWVNRILGFFIIVMVSMLCVFILSKIIPYVIKSVKSMRTQKEM